MVLGFQCLVWSCEVTSLGFIVIITTITIISITKAEIRGRCHKKRCDDPAQNGCHRSTTVTGTIVSVIFERRLEQQRFYLSSEHSIQQ